MIRFVHPGSGSRIRSLIFYPSRVLIFYPSRIQGSKKHRIPDPQHCWLDPSWAAWALPNIRFGVARGVEAIGTDEAAPLLVHHFQHPPGIYGNNEQIARYRPCGIRIQIQVLQLHSNVKMSVQTLSKKLFKHFFPTNESNIFLKFI